MAKVTGPLLSLSASGTIAETITFVCGHFARKKQEKTGEQPEHLVGQGDTFKAGVDVWRAMTASQKKSWGVFRKIIVSAPECSALKGEITGYNLYLSHYLRYGVDGWENYPAAPSVLWLPGGGGVAA